jgi:hypothetical protein
VNPDRERTLTEEDRFALIPVQALSTVDEEEDCKLKDPAGPVMRFLQGTKWRKHSARIKLDLDEEDIDSEMSREAVAQGESENLSEGHSSLHPTSVSAAAIGSLPAREANTQVDGDEEDDRPVDPRAVSPRTGRRIIWFGLIGQEVIEARQTLADEKDIPYRIPCRAE